MPSKDPKDRQVERIILIEGFVNLSVLLAKLVVGLSSGSMAVLSDALHSLTDMANNLVAFAVLRHAAKPADKEHPYGHRKFETLAVLGLAILLVVLAFELILQAFRGDSEPAPSASWEIAVMTLVLLVNISLASWQRGWAKRLDSSLLKADANHTFADALTTIAVILGWQLSTLGYPWLDRLTAIGVALIILYLAVDLFKKAAPILVDEYAVDPDLLSKKVSKIPQVEKVSRVRSRWIGALPSVDMVISVAPEISTQDAHDICDQIESLIESEFNVTDVSIHVEPFQRT